MHMMHNLPTVRQTGGLTLHRHVCREMAPPGTASSSEKVCVCVGGWGGMGWGVCGVVKMYKREPSLHLLTVKMHIHPTLAFKIYSPFLAVNLLSKSLFMA